MPTEKPLAGYREWRGKAKDMLYFKKILLLVLIFITCSTTIITVIVMTVVFYSKAPGKL